MSALDNLLRAIASALGGGPEESTRPEAESPPDPAAEVAAVNKQLRETAKWILTSFAAVAAILVGGLQLSSIGKLTAETPDARVWAALGGIATAALGVAIAVGFMSRVLEPALNSLSTVADDVHAADQALAEPMGMTFNDLKGKIDTLDADVKRAKAKGTSSPEYRAALEARNKWEPTRQDALVLIGAERLRSRYETARKAIVAAVILVVAGVVAFAWGANPPDDEKEAEPVTLAEVPVLLNVRLSDTGVTALEIARGCDRPLARVLTLGGKPTEREVVTIPSGRCRAVRFILTPSLGTATAALRP